MGQITLVRHGQATQGAQDEDTYDNLSPLGYTQAGWLGDWLRDRGETYDLVLSGSLRRHRQTAAAMGHADPTIDPRLNEMDYLNLAAALRDTHGVPLPGPDGFADHLLQVMQAWHLADIKGNETFASFESRITEVLAEAAVPGRRVLCITSGGVIGMMMRHILGLDLERLARICLPIHNTSLHRIHVIDQGSIVAGFNAIPHLEHPDRAAARTHS